MFGLGGLDPKKMQGLMKQMGIKQDEVRAERVVIECSDRNIVIENPSVQKIVMQGKEMWQISGEAKEEAGEEGVKEEDVKLVAEKTGKDEKEAEKALEEAEGDIAEAIAKLNQKFG